MAISNGYADLDEFKAWIRAEGLDAPDDIVIENLINATSRGIDRELWRRFYAATETRYYTAARRDVLQVDDLLDITVVEGWIKTDSDGDRTYENTFATTDYDLMPFNASLDGEPYTSIEITPNGSYSFPTISKGIEIKGSFGYSATTPAGIHEACVIICNDYYKKRFGENTTGVSRFVNWTGGTVLTGASFTALTVIAIVSVSVAIVSLVAIVSVSAPLKLRLPV